MKINFGGHKKAVTILYKPEIQVHVFMTLEGFHIAVGPDDASAKNRGGRRKAIFQKSGNHGLANKNSVVIKYRVFPW